MTSLGLNVPEGKAMSSESNSNGTLLKWIVGVLTAVLIFALTQSVSWVIGLGARIEQQAREQAVMGRDIDYLKQTAQETNEGVKALRLSIESERARRQRREEQ